MNIVFDLGGVVFHWNPDELIASCFSSEGEQKIVKKHFLSHPDWAELDRGTMDKESALRNAEKRSGISYDRLKKILDITPDFLAPKSETIDLIHRIKEKGHKLFILSNMHHDSMNHLDRTYSFLELFDGKVASCRVGLVKPEEEIYEYLLNAFSLAPEETVFIDDMKENVDAASRLGIHPIQFKDARQCEEALKDLGCL